MIGFEISINGREPIVAASDYFVFADLTFGCSSGRIKIKGSDGLHYLTWLTEKLEEGDRVLIKMVVTDKVSPVLTIEDCDRNEMIGLQPCGDGGEDEGLLGTDYGGGV